MMSFFLCIFFVLFGDHGVHGHTKWVPATNVHAVCGRPLMRPQSMPSVQATSS